MLNTLPAPNLISAMELRRRPGQFLDRVDYRNESFLIERDGEPKAVLIPVEAYRAIQRQQAEARRRLSAIISAVRVCNQGRDPQAIETAINSEIETYRRAQSW